MKRKVKKSVIRLILRVVSICILSYFCITLISYTVKIKTLKEQKNKLSNELIDLKTKEENLKTEILKLNDKEYIARYAREHYLYTKDGEFVIRIDEKETKEEKVIEEHDNNKILYTAGITSLIILITIFIKKKYQKKKHFKA